MNELDEEEIRQGAKPISKLPLQEIFAFRAKPNSAYNGMIFWYTGRVCSETHIQLKGGGEPFPVTYFTHYAEIGEDQKKEFIETLNRSLNLHHYKQK
jgi:hypothetical protein